MSMEVWLPVLASMAEELSEDGIAVQARTSLNLPDSLGSGLWLIITPESGPSANYSAGGPNIAMHNIVMGLYHVPGILPVAHKRLIPLIAKVRNKYAAHMQLNGLLAGGHILTRAPFYEGPGDLSYGGNTYVGVKFYYEVKEHETFTVAP